jgi:multidrug efflux system membrane fusion protein
VYLNGLGNVTAFYTVSVKSRVDGQIMKLDFNEGDLVQQGQLLMKLTPALPGATELAEGTLARNQAMLNNAKLDLQRYQTLLAQDAIPKQQWIHRPRWAVRATSNGIRPTSAAPNSI